MRTFDRWFWVSISVFLICSIAIGWLPYLLTQQGSIDFTKTGNIGDTIGGIMGPFTAICVGGLTFLAFWVQFKANLQQRHDIRIERFENKLYELIRLHKSNVDEFNFDDRVKGRKCFKQMIGELRQVKNWVSVKSDLEFFLNDTDKDKQALITLNLAYKIFFFGLGYDNENQIMGLVNKHEKKTFDEIKPELRSIQDAYRSFRNKSDQMYHHQPTLQGESAWYTLEIDYHPFQGHSEFLGHYFRHLFQSVKFVDEQSFLSSNQKRAYLKTLRAQLSNEEQLLLYYNALCDMGNPWFENQYFERFFLIKNIPLDMIDMGVHPHYKIGIANEQNQYYFEWDELKRTPIKTKETLIAERAKQTLAESFKE
jgi:hypothetical protein